MNTNKIVDRNNGFRLHLPLYAISTPLFVVLVFLLSLIINPYYTGGDQVHYRAVYEKLPELGIIEGFTFYSSALSSVEFVHFLLSWLASRIVEKDLFIALANAALAYATILIFIKWRVSQWITALFLFSNFYWLALYFSAERLKFGVLFMLFSMIYIGRGKAFYLLTFIALISHIQLVLIYASLLFRFISKKLLRFFTTGFISKSMFWVIFFSFIPVIVMSDQLVTKFYAYFKIHNPFDLLRIFIFFGLTLWYSRNRFETTLIFIPIIISVLLVGGDRVNMLGYFVFLYYALPINRGLNVGVFATTLYYMFSSFHFLVNIFAYGNGFYSI